MRYDFEGRALPKAVHAAVSEYMHSILRELGRNVQAGAVAGSYARGNPSMFCDLDLLVLTDLAWRQWRKVASTDGLQLDVTICPVNHFHQCVQFDSWPKLLRMVAECIPLYDPYDLIAQLKVAAGRKLLSPFRMETRNQLVRDSINHNFRKLAAQTTDLSFEIYASKVLEACVRSHYRRENQWPDNLEIMLESMLESVPVSVRSEVAALMDRRVRREFRVQAARALARFSAGADPAVAHDILGNPLPAAPVGKMASRGRSQHCALHEF